jgi:hypothetical protein|tara:strand:+ start:2374 stop:2562 length:189 start_codon:yes stop_codon:yes gene_type:complete
MSKNHGGAREGAGRKPLDPERKASTRGITLPARDWKKLDEHRGTLSPSHFIRSLISKLRKKR